MKTSTFFVSFAVVFASAAFKVADPSDSKRLVCDLYPPLDSMNKTTELCTGPDWSCFVLWTSSIKDNQTIAFVHKKGCFKISYEREDKPPACGEECIQQPHYDAFRSDNVSGFCCCTENRCNRNFTMTPYEETEVPTILLTPTQADEDNLPMNVLVITIVCVLVVLLVTMGFVVQFVITRKAVRYAHAPDCEKDKGTEEMPCIDLGLLQLDQLIGQGKYGSVWKATLDGKIRAVKVFPLEYQMYWQSEKDFYTSGISHPNLLKFFAADERQNEYLLVTEYHHHGSLMSFLQKHTTSWKESCNLLYSVAAGLAFLHEITIEGELTKSAFVHRDVNSKNVLVDSNGMCVLSDFGFAMEVTNGVKSVDDSSFIGEVGTVRYMAPEVLDGAVNLHDCHAALKAVDVYSLGLVLWEIAMRCRDMFGKEDVPEYKMPYERELGPLFSVEDLRKYVGTDKMRPNFPDAWKQNHSGIRALKDTIEECWDQDGDARLSAMTVSERMRDLARDDVACVTVEPTIQPFQQNFKAPLSSSASTSGLGSMTPSDGYSREPSDHVC